MNKKVILIAASAVCIALIGVLIYMNTQMKARQEENEQMIEVLKMDKAEMENEYEQFAMQYNEMMAQINNDSLINQLSIEQERVQKLLAELKQTKADNAREIMRLKKELATLRAILKDYVMQIDSLNRENMALKVDNDKLRNQNQQAQAHITDLSTEKEQLVEKVAIASQLNATNFSAIANNKRGKETDKIKKAKKFIISFTLARNVTTQTGMRTIYVRIATPTGAILTSGGTFQYENRDLQYSIAKEVEYTGEELPVTVYWDIAESLSAGEYRVDIFCDGQNIGTTTFSMRQTMGKGKLAKFADMAANPLVVERPYRPGDEPVRLDWHKEFFKNDNPIILELGCGRGEYTVGMGALYPHNNYIGVDIKGARMWTGAQEAMRMGMQNVGFLRTNIEFIDQFFSPGEVSEIWLTFSDPQMKKATKRLTSTYFLQRYRKIMKDGGIVHLKTDSNFLFTYTEEMLKANSLQPLVCTRSLYSETGEDTAEARSRQTYYEEMWRSRGIDIKYLAFRLPHEGELKEPDVEIEFDEYRSYGRNKRSGLDAGK